MSNKTVVVFTKELKEKLEREGFTLIGEVSGEENKWLFLLDNTIKFNFAAQPSNSYFISNKLFF